VEPYHFLDTPWYWTSRRYRSAKLGWEAWSKLEEKLAGKNLDLGIYRHGPSASPGTMVTCVSLHSQGVLQARRILRDEGGADVPLGAGINELELEALIARRIRAVAQLTAENPGESGSAIYHHLGRGRAIDPDGSYR
jgi:hypothetical protein